MAAHYTHTMATMKIDSLSSIDKRKLLDLYTAHLELKLATLYREISVIEPGDPNHYNDLEARLRLEASSAEESLKAVRKIDTIPPGPSDRVADLSLVEVEQVNRQKASAYFFVPASDGPETRLKYDGVSIIVCSRAHRLFGQKVGFTFESHGAVDERTNTTFNTPRRHKITRIL